MFQPTAGPEVAAERMKLKQLESYLEENVAADEMGAKAEAWGAHSLPPWGNDPTRGLWGRPSRRPGT